MKSNDGELPPEAIGKRVRVVLACGLRPVDDPAMPPGWAADGRGGCRWSLTGHPSDIARFEVIR